MHYDKRTLWQKGKNEKSGVDWSIVSIKGRRPVKMDERSDLIA